MCPSISVNKCQIKVNTIMHCDTVPPEAAIPKSDIRAVPQ